MLLETKEGHPEEENAGENTPKGSFREVLHDQGVTFVLHVHPHEDEGAGERHDSDQAGCRWHFLPDCRRNQDDDNAKNGFDNDLHSLLSCSMRELSGRPASRDAVKVKSSQVRANAVELILYLFGAFYI